MEAKKLQNEICLNRYSSGVHSISPLQRSTQSDRIVPIDVTEAMAVSEQS